MSTAADDHTGGPIALWPGYQRAGRLTLRSVRASPVILRSTLMLLMGAFAVHRLRYLLSTGQSASGAFSDHGLVGMHAGQELLQGALTHGHTSGLIGVFVPAAGSRS